MDVAGGVQLYMHHSRVLSRILSLGEVFGIMIGGGLRW